MQITETTIPEIKLLTPTRHADERGHFSELYSRRTLAGLGLDFDFVQDNLALSRRPGTVRGLHFQAPPEAQVKLVAVLRGAILDVAVDLRHGSPSFGRHVAVRLEAETGTQLLVPEGFAHGYCTLEPDSLVFYKVTRPYAPQHDHGLSWSDPALGIAWPVSPSAAIVSARDRRLPPLAALPVHFRHEES
jgi:dTDP-4-dehydrorhamnose 3,5-epimerase